MPARFQTFFSKKCQFKAHGSHNTTFSQTEKGPAITELANKTIFVKNYTKANQKKMDIYI